MNQPMNGCTLFANRKNHITSRYIVKTNRNCCAGTDMRTEL